MYVRVYVEGQCGVEWGWWGELTLHWYIANTPPVDVVCLFVVGCASDAVHTFMYILSTSLARCSEGLTCIPAFIVAKICETGQHSSILWDLLVICGGVEGPGVLYVLYHRIALSDSPYKVCDEGRVNHFCPGHFCKSRNLSCINVAFLAYVLKCLCYISPHQSTTSL